MKAVSDDYSFDTAYLKRPNPTHRRLFLKAKEMIDFPRNIKVKFYIMKGSLEETMLAGIAARIIDYGRKEATCDDPIAIIITEGLFEERIQYIMYILKHELRHCIPKKGQLFRWHDKEFLDGGWEERGKPDIYNGMFYEDLKEISCCDVMLWYFRTLKGIEDYLL